MTKIEKLSKVFKWGDRGEVLPSKPKEGKVLNSSQQIVQYLHEHPKLSEKEFYSIIKVLGYQSQRGAQEVADSLNLLSSDPAKNNRKDFQNINAQLAEVAHNITSLIEATKRFYPNKSRATKVNITPAIEALTGLSDVTTDEGIDRVIATLESMEVPNNNSKAPEDLRRNRLDSMIQAIGKSIPGLLFLSQIVVLAIAKDIHSTELTFIGLATGTYFFFKLIKM